METQAKDARASSAAAALITQATLDAIKEQTTQLERQVKASHDGLRAWIGIDVRENEFPATFSFDAIDRINSAMAPRPPRFEWEILNSGQTPAFIKSINVYNRAHPIKNAGSWEELSNPIRPNRFLGSEKSERHVLTLPDDALRQCELREMTWRFVAKIGYDDAFGREHETMASFHYYIPTGPADPIKRGFYQDTDPSTNYNS